MHIAKREKPISKGSILCNPNPATFWDRNSVLCRATPSLLPSTLLCQLRSQVPSLTQLQPRSPARAPGLPAPRWACRLPLASELGAHSVTSRVSLPSGVTGFCWLMFSIFHPVVLYMSSIVGCFRWESKSSPYYSILARSRNLAFALIFMGFQSREEITHVLFSP